MKESNTHKHSSYSIQQHPDPISSCMCYPRGIITHRQRRKNTIERCSWIILYDRQSLITPHTHTHIASLNTDFIYYSCRQKTDRIKYIRREISAVARSYCVNRNSISELVGFDMDTRNIDGLASERKSAFLLLNNDVVKKRWSFLNDRRSASGVV